MAHVDLHCHSTASDGQFPPADVVRRAQASRLPEEIQLEKRLQSLVTYAPDAWELWNEVPLAAPADA